mmetsp:Transcript_79971/g.205737  ORF Transcript_79971/g.205737 Transcript_79971/m.205737 type:complete len:297 (+) Transcript_79971:598-1488(+)
MLLPLALHEPLEVLVAPSRWGVRPRALEAACEGVVAHAASARRVGTRSMNLAEGVPATDQGDGLSVVHAHPRERITDVGGAGRWVRIRTVLAVRIQRHRSFGIHVDQSHRCGAERLLALAVDLAGRVSLLVRAGAQVQAGGAVWVIDAAEAILADGATHGLDRDGPCRDEEVSPAELVPVLLLDGSQQCARMIQVGVVLPAGLRLETLAATTAAPTAISGAVGAGAMPGEPDEEGAIVPKVRGPADLGVGEEMLQILDQRPPIQLVQGLLVLWNPRDWCVALWGRALVIPGAFAHR